MHEPEQLHALGAFVLAFLLMLMLMLMLMLTLTLMLMLMLTLMLMLMLLLQVRKLERVWKQSADEHAIAVLALEAKLAGKQREVADLQQLNSSLFSRFQAMRSQLARTEDKLSHDKLKGGCSFIPVCWRTGLSGYVHQPYECHITVQGPELF